MQTSLNPPECKDRGLRVEIRKANSAGHGAISRGRRMKMIT